MTNETISAAIWTVYVSAVMVAQPDPGAVSVVTGLTTHTAYLVGCMTGGTIGAALWRDSVEAPPGFGTLLGRWVVCACVGLILTPSVLWAIGQFTSVPMTPNTALLASGASSFSGYWFITYLRERGPGGLLEMAKEILAVVRGGGGKGGEK